jgi:hypothetical protein
MTKHEAIWEDIEARTLFGHLDIDERWKDVVGWEGRYQVSNIGRVRSIQRRGRQQSRILSQRGINREGYLGLTISAPGRKRKTVCTHKLVAEAWLGPCPKGKQVRHGPGLRFDNTVPNLCYGTPMQDLEDRRRDGTSNERPVRRSDGMEYPSIATAARDLEISPAHIRVVCQGQGKTAAGFGWEYILEERAYA